MAEETTSVAGLAVSAPARAKVMNASSPLGDLPARSIDPVNRDYYLRLFFGGGKRESRVITRPDLTYGLLSNPGPHARPAKVMVRLLQMSVTQNLGQARAMDTTNSPGTPADASRQMIDLDGP